MNINKKLIVSLSIVGIIAILIMVTIGSFLSFSNGEIDLSNRFKQKMDERTAFYDKMWKTISQKSQIALKNDSSFTKNVKEF